MLMQGLANVKCVLTACMITRQCCKASHLELESHSVLRQGHVRIHIFCAVMLCYWVSGSWYFRGSLCISLLGLGILSLLVLFKDGCFNSWSFCCRMQWALCTLWQWRYRWIGTCSKQLTNNVLSRVNCLLTVCCWHHRHWHMTRNLCAHLPG